MHGRVAAPRAERADALLGARTERALEDEVARGERVRLAESERDVARGPGADPREGDEARLEFRLDRERERLAARRERADRGGARAREADRLDRARVGGGDLRAVGGEAEAAYVFARLGERSRETSGEGRRSLDAHLLAEDRSEGE